MQDKEYHRYHANDLFLLSLFSLLSRVVNISDVIVMTWGNRSGFTNQYESISYAYFSHFLLAMYLGVVNSGACMKIKPSLVLINGDLGPGSALVCISNTNGKTRKGFWSAEVGTWEWKYSITWMCMF